MIVIDTSIFIDSLFEKDKHRNELATKLLNSTENLTAFIPRILLIEFIAVSKRLGINLSREEITSLVEDFSLLSEDIIFEEAFKIAEEIHPRAIDSLFIAVTKLTNSILITNDKTMSKNAKKYGLEAYYLIDDFSEVLKRIDSLK